MICDYHLAEYAVRRMGKNIGEGWCPRDAKSRLERWLSGRLVSGKDDALVCFESGSVGAAKRQIVEMTEMMVFAVGNGWRVQVLLEEKYWYDGVEVDNKRRNKILLVFHRKDGPRFNRTIPMMWTKGGDVE